MADNLSSLTTSIKNVPAQKQIVRGITGIMTERQRSLNILKMVAMMDNISLTVSIEQGGKKFKLTQEGSQELFWGSYNMCL